MAKKINEELINKSISNISNGKVVNLNDLEKLSNGTTAEINDFYNYINLMVDKIVQQELSSPVISSVFDSWKKFKIDNLVGSAKSFVKVILNQLVYDDLTGTTNYLPSKKKKDGTIEVSRFDGGMVEQISDPIFKKQTNYTQSMIQTIGKVNTKEKIVQLIALMVQTYYNTFNLYMFNKTMKKILDYFNSDSFNGMKIVDEESQNNYQCAMKLNLVVKNMATSLTNKFVLNPKQLNKDGQDALFSKVMTATNGNELIILVHPNIKQKWEMGTKAGIFNPEMTAFLKNVPAENIIELPMDQYINDAYDEAVDNDPISKNIPYIDENTIVAINKKALVTLFQNNKSGNQYYAANDTQYLTQHLWFSQTILGFSTGFIYKCANLNKSITDQTIE